MITFLKLCDKCVYTLSSKSSRFNACTELIKVFVTRHIHQHQPKFQIDSEEFRVLDLKPKKSRPFTRKQIEKAIAMPPRSNQMPVDQEWGNVWPGPRTFHPASVPLPIRQGFPNKRQAPPGKFGNAELMKIPNFLHLTPPAIKKHCESLKQFCTEWPKGLNSEEQEKLFPLEVITSDYCHSSPVIRDPMARIVTLKVNLNSLILDDHAKDKLLRLVENCYDPDTNVITIMADRCPLKQQNYDYILYVLTALYHEAWKKETWEQEKSEADMEFYDWAKSVSRQNILSYLSLSSNDTTNDTSPHLPDYEQAVSELFNQGEDDYTLFKYKESTKKLFEIHEDQTL